MTKKILLVAFIMLLLGMTNVNAQDDIKLNVPKHAVSVQLPLSLTKAGIGARFSYDYTENLRFTIDGNYYFYSSIRAQKRTVDRNDLTKTGKIAWGRRADLNFNANFKFGKDNFHIYMIAGFYLTVGYSNAKKIVGAVYDLATLGEIQNTDDDGIDDYVYGDDGYKYYYTDRLKKMFNFGGGLNVGFGADYQINEHNRVFLEQHAALGSMLGVFVKLGYTWCF